MSDKLNEFSLGLYKLKEELESNLRLIEKREAELDKEELAFKERVHDKYINFYIEGELFRIYTTNILKFKSSLLYSTIIKLPEEVIKSGIYIDRSPKHFERILNFLKHKTVDLSDLNIQLINEVRDEAKYYELEELIDYIDNKYIPPRIISYLSNGPFFYSYNPVGDIDVESICNENRKTGLTVNSPALITFELKSPTEINGIYAIGYYGSSYFSNSSGLGSLIYTSIDNKKFIEVGTLDSFEKKIKLKKSKAKYIQFENKVGYIGFSYLEILR